MQKSRKVHRLISLKLVEKKSGANQFESRTQNQILVLNLQSTKEIRFFRPYSIYVPWLRRGHCSA